MHPREGNGKYIKSLPYSSMWGALLGGIGQLQRYSNRDSIDLPCSRMLTSLCLPVINAKEWGAYLNEMSRPCTPI